MSSSEKAGSASVDAIREIATGGPGRQSAEGLPAHADSIRRRLAALAADAADDTDDTPAP